MANKIRVVNGEGRVKYVTPSVVKDARSMRAQGYWVEELKEENQALEQKNSQKKNNKPDQ